MEDAIAAKAAVDHLNGTALMGGVLTVEWDTSSGMNTKLIVKGVPAIAGWQEVKDHFKVMSCVRPRQTAASASLVWPYCVAFPRVAAVVVSRGFLSRGS